MNFKNQFGLFFLMILLIISSISTRLYAQCPNNGVTPIQIGTENPNNGFATWVRDTNGVALELCLDTNYCFFDPPIFGNPFSQQIGFGEEAFWWSADARITTPQLDAILILAVEAAFLGPVENGEQFPFTRLRIRMDVPSPGTYTVIHPYGQETFNVESIGPGQEIRMSRDIEMIGFNTLHNGAVGPVLVAVDPLPPTGFVGDINIDQRVTGSPCGTNFFRVIGPAGVDLGNGPGVPVETDLFAVQGKLFTGVLPTQLAVDRTTYSRTSTTGQIDVFATSAPTAIVSVSGSPGLPTGEIFLTGDGTGRFYKNLILDDPSTIPSFLTITANRAGESTTSINSNLVDLVTITKAEYNVENSTLTVEANSSDRLSSPTLTLVGYGNLTSGQIIVNNVTVPPSVVTVTSSIGGSATLPVTVIPFAQATYSISGTITFSPENGGGPATGVTVILTSGTLTRVTSTDTNGVYIFSGLADGSYTITPNRSGYSFNPSNLTVNISGADVSNQNFTATLLNIFSISGTITSGGTPIEGVSVVLTGPVSAEVTTNASGLFTFSNLPNGTYTITPSHQNYNFSPLNRTVTINGSNVIGQIFIGTLITRSISGTITTTTGPLAGVAVFLTGPVNRTVTTNNSGVYNFTGLLNGNYVVTPVLTGYSFTPTTANVIVNNADVTGINFSAVNRVFSVSGRVINQNGAGVANVIIKLTGTGVIKTVRTNVFGNFTITGVANGNYVVSPEPQPGFVFDPINRNVTVNNANVTGIRFRRTLAPQ